MTSPATRRLHTPDSLHSTGHWPRIGQNWPRIHQHWRWSSGRVKSSPSRALELMPGVASPSGRAPSVRDPRNQLQRQNPSQNAEVWPQNPILERLCHGVCLGLSGLLGSSVGLADTGCPEAGSGGLSNKRQDKGARRSDLGTTLRRSGSDSDAGVDSGGCETISAPVGTDVRGADATAP